MKQLLQRQIEKHFGNTVPDGMQFFLDAIEGTYNDYDNRIYLLQRAMKISSDELYEANQKLRAEAENLKEINRNLETILSSMNTETSLSGGRFDSVEYIRRQSAEIIRINTQREELLLNLERQNRELNDYAHVVSHDLKAPLRSIDTLINWFIEDNQATLKEKDRQTLDTVLSSVEKMDMLIKGILDYSTIDKLESESRVVNLHEMVADLIPTLLLPPDFDIEIENNLPSLYGNYYRFRQLFQNLIENAVKYNDKQYGTVVIGCRNIPGHTEFFVKDNGRGIPAAYHSKIFDIFTKLDNENHSSGIGLSIVQKILNFYNGTIRLDSEEGVGTTFYFTLPNIGTAKS